MSYPFHHAALENCVDHWERVETGELPNPRINYLQGEITGTGAFRNKEKNERRLLQRGNRKSVLGRRRTNGLTV